MIELNKKKITINLVIYIAVFAIIGTVFLVSTIASKNNVKESIASNKEYMYERYLESLENSDNMSTVEANMSIANISKEAIENVDFQLQDEYYQKERNGNKYLEKLRQEAVKELNNALNILLSDEQLEVGIYDLSDIIVDTPEYVSKENMALYVALDKREKVRYAQAEKEREEERKDEPKGSSKSEDGQIDFGAEYSLTSGLSEREVISIMGRKARDITKTPEAEFWTYNEVVLTMKNGFVYDVAR